MEPSATHSDSKEQQPPGMDLSAVEEQKTAILEKLKSKDVKAVILVGDPGVGKTWMAREVSQKAITDDLCYAALWVSMRVKHESLFKSIGRQLSLSSPMKKLDDDDIDEEEENLDNLKRAISKKLQDLREHQKEKFLLVIVDDEVPHVKEEELSQLEEMLEGKSQLEERLEGKSQLEEMQKGKPQPKYLKTRSSDAGRVDLAPSEWEYRIKPLSVAESFTLFDSIVKGKNSTFREDIVKKSMGSPAAIKLMAEALCRSDKCSSEVWEPESLLKEATGIEESVKDISHFVQCSYDMLPRGIMSDCFWHCQEFFQRYDSVNYNDLIIHWIMEGYFVHINHVEKAYEEGFEVLMEFINRGILKIQEDNVVLMEGSKQRIIDCHHPGFTAMARLGLTSVVQEEIQRGFGRVAQADGMIKSAKSWENVSTLLINGSRLSREVPEKFFKRIKQVKFLAIFQPMLKLLLPLSQLDQLCLLVLRGCDQLGNIKEISKLKRLTILEISGTKSVNAIPDNFFEQLTMLQSLNLSGTQIKRLPTLSNVMKLRWLVLKQCLSLEDLPKLNSLVNLEVIDFSGAESFKKFQEKSFRNLQKLHTLNLSSTKVERLPIVSGLEKLTRVLLKGCKCLTRLPKLEKLPGLQVLDLADAAHVNEINSDSFEGTDSLRVLDLSKTSFDHLPSNITKLSELYLRNCPELKELSGIGNISGLRVLDASESSLVQINDKLSDNLTALYDLDLSKTKITTLPSLSNLHNLRSLLLRDCLCLEEMPEFGGPARLRVLDISGCKNLHKLPPLDALQQLEVLDLSGCSALVNQSFDHMSCLQRLNLSGTMIQSLAALFSDNLSHLMLRGCINLKVLPSQIETFTKLEELDLYNARSLGRFDIGVLKDMTQLQNLFLSHVTLKDLQLVSNLTKLKQLCLKECSGLAVGETVEFPPKLEVLDLSGTDVENLSSITKNSRLRKLLLRGCSKLTELPSLKSLIHLELLDLSESGVKCFPYEISEMTHLKHLDLGEVKFSNEVEWHKIHRLPDELNWSPLQISSPADALPGAKKPSVMVNGTAFFQSLQEKSTLRDACLKQTYFSVCHPMDDEKMHPDRELLINDIYFHVRNFSDYKEKGQSMEIYGFDKFPTGLGETLKDVQYLSFVGNRCVSCLSDFGDGNFKNMKGCWLDNCVEMKGPLFNGADAKLAETLEILWVSNIPELKSLSGEKVESLNLNNLTYLHIDCCPMLENVFPLPPVLENLENLQIQFCDKLETLFKFDEAGKRVLKKLKAVRLLQLPELKTLGVRLPYLEVFDSLECPKLEDKKDSLIG